jgi:hypothetical protein
MNNRQIPVFFIKQVSIFYNMYSSNEELLSGVYIFKPWDDGIFVENGFQTFFKINFLPWRFMMELRSARLWLCPETLQKKFLSKVV